MFGSFYITIVIIKSIGYNAQVTRGRFQVTDGKKNVMNGKINLLIRN